MSGDPVSWFLIERGWDVLGAGGEELGSVHEVVGDSGSDIFNGLTVSPGLLRSSRYVPAEVVGELVAGSVRLTIGADEFKRLGEAGAAPPSAAIRADTTDLPDADRP